LNEDESDDRQGNGDAFEGGAAHGIRVRIQ
jgi:hypothetical protein